MGFSDEDKILMKNLHDSKTAPKKLMKELPENVGANVDCHATSCLPETSP